MVDEHLIDITGRLESYLKLLSTNFYNSPKKEGLTKLFLVMNLHSEFANLCWAVSTDAKISNQTKDAKMIGHIDQAYRISKSVHSMCINPLQISTMLWKRDYLISRTQN